MVNQRVIYLLSNITFDSHSEPALNCKSHRAVYNNRECSALGQVRTTWQPSRYHVSCCPVCFLTDSTHFNCLSCCIFFSFHSVSQHAFYSNPIVQSNFVSSSWLLLIFVFSRHLLNSSSLLSLHHTPTSSFAFFSTSTFLNSFQYPFFLVAQCPRLISILSAHSV